MVLSVASCKDSDGGKEDSPIEGFSRPLKVASQDLDLLPAADDDSGRPPEGVIPAEGKTFSLSFPDLGDRELPHVAYLVDKKTVFVASFDRDKETKKVGDWGSFEYNTSTIPYTADFRIAPNNGATERTISISLDYTFYMTRIDLTQAGKTE